MDCKKQLMNIEKIIINKPLIILAGGFGTRLKSVLNGLPKPMADINGSPFILYLLQNLRNKGFSDFIFSLHYQPYKIIDYIESIKDKQLINCKITYVIEPIPMGTGGAISYIIEKNLISDSFFVTNADTWIEDGYSIINNLEGNVIGVVEVEETERYGRISVDKDGFVLKFLEKDINNGKGLINAGIYKLSKSEFKNWDGKPYSLEKDFFSILIANKSIKAINIKSNFIDIGIPEDYNKFCNRKIYLNESR